MTSSPSSSSSPPELDDLKTALTILDKAVRLFSASQNF
jgi:hypothetical protein